MMAVMSHTKTINNERVTPLTGSKGLPITFEKTNAENQIVINTGAVKILHLVSRHFVRWSSPIPASKAMQNAVSGTAYRKLLVLSNSGK